MTVFNLEWVSKGHSLCCFQISTDIRSTLHVSKPQLVCDLQSQRLFSEDLCLDRANGRGGFGSQTAADPPATLENPEKQTVGTATASHKILTLQALASSLNAGIARRGCLG